MAPFNNDRLFECKTNIEISMTMVSSLINNLTIVQQWSLYPGQPPEKKKAFQVSGAYGTVPFNGIQAHKPAGSNICTSVCINAGHEAFWGGFVGKKKYDADENQMQPNKPAAFNPCLLIWQAYFSNRLIPLKESCLRDHCMHRDESQSKVIMLSHFMWDRSSVLLSSLISPPGVFLFSLQETEAGEGAGWNVVEDSLGGPSVREPQ